MPRLICLLKEFTQGKELLRPEATRFATTYLTLGRLHELKSALISFFTSEQWLTTNYERIDLGKNIKDIVMDTSRFWPSVADCLRVAHPIMKALRSVDSYSKPAMGFIYQDMVFVKEIKGSFKDVESAPYFFVYIYWY